MPQITNSPDSFLRVTVEFGSQSSATLIQLKQNQGFQLSLVILSGLLITKERKKSFSSFTFKEAFRPVAK